MNIANVGDGASCSLHIIGFIGFLVTHSITGHKLRQLKKQFETKLNTSSTTQHSPRDSALIKLLSEVFRQKLIWNLITQTILWF